MDGLPMMLLVVVLEMVTISNTMHGDRSSVYICITLNIYYYYYYYYYLFIIIFIECLQ